MAATEKQNSSHTWQAILKGIPSFAYFQFLIPLRSIRDKRNPFVISYPSPSEILNYDCGIKSVKIYHMLDKILS
jgi:ABC-type proline/glycine betaine transport system permease subunit